MVICELVESDIRERIDCNVRAVGPYERPPSHQGRRVTQEEIGGRSARAANGRATHPDPGVQRCQSTLSVSKSLTDAHDSRSERRAQVRRPASRSGRSETFSTTQPTLDANDVPLSRSDAPLQSWVRSNQANLGDEREIRIADDPERSAAAVVDVFDDPDGYRARHAMRSTSCVAGIRGTRSSRSLMKRSPKSLGDS
jgi:hypothetical protein